MFKLISIILLSLFISSISSMGFALNLRKITFDFSGIKLDVAPDVRWVDYSEWMIAYKGQVSGASMPGWKGEPIHNLTTSQFIDHNAMTGVSYQMLAVGVTKDDGLTFIPATTPMNCLIQLHGGETIYISGILHVPGSSQPPYIVNLGCRVGR